MIESGLGYSFTRPTRRAVSQFLTYLKGAGVDGVALLISRQRPAPTTLVFDVLMPLIPGDPSTRMKFDQVMEVNRMLLERLPSPLAMSLKFVNTASRPIREVELLLEREWLRNPKLTLVRFFDFTDSQNGRAR